MVAWSGKAARVSRSSHKADFELLAAKTCPSPVVHVSHTWLVFMGFSGHFPMVGAIFTDLVESLNHFISSIWCFYLALCL